jgi:DNA-binding CsgD family transcriptional regulator
VKKADGRKRAAYVNSPRGRASNGLPEIDAAHGIVSGILAVVPASRWTFARVEANGDVVSVFGSADENGALPDLSDEFARQRAKITSGSRIAAVLGTLYDLSSGITLLFADARVSYGILIILRDAELGPFTSAELSVLTFALDAVSDHLAALRLQPPSNDSSEPSQIEQARLTAENPQGAFYVLDTDLNIILTWSAEEQLRVALTGVHTRAAERLPTVLEATVRELTATWAVGAENRSGTARPVSFLVVRTQPMSGRSGLFIGVRVDRYKPANSLTAVAARFHISPREVQVLALLLDGNHLDQIAKQLFITSSTVQDHIKSMLDKTGSGNRSELIARILGWEYAPATLGTD